MSARALVVVVDASACAPAVDRGARALRAVVHALSRPPGTRPPPPGRIVASSLLTTLVAPALGGEMRGALLACLRPDALAGHPNLVRRARRLTNRPRRDVHSLRGTTRDAPCSGRAARIRAARRARSLTAQPLACSRPSPTRPAGVPLRPWPARPSRRPAARPRPQAALAHPRRLPPRSRRLPPLPPACPATPRPTPPPRPCNLASLPSSRVSRRQIAAPPLLRPWRCPWTPLALSQPRRRSRHHRCRYRRSRRCRARRAHTIRSIACVSSSPTQSAHALRRSRASGCKVRRS